MVQKPCFWGETVREWFGNRDSAAKPFGNGLETVYLWWNRSV